jgi:N,N'-diacetyllegionaminate synthase
MDWSFRTFRKNAGQAVRLGSEPVTRFGGTEINYSMGDDITKQKAIGIMMEDIFKIGDHEIGEGKRCFIIGEVAQAHDGSLGAAHAYIDAIADAGADAVKFQTHIADAESSPEEPWRVHFSTQDRTRFEYWKRMEFTEQQWIALKEHAEQRGLVFLSSPFSEQAVDMLARMDMAAWKIASGEISNLPLLKKIIDIGKPILLSTGMSAYLEIDSAVELVKSNKCPVAVMQCTSSYPTPPEKLGLNLISEYRDRYNCPVGLSDHSATIFAGLAAAAFETDILELHVTLSKEMFGPDVIASVTTTELQELVKGIRFIESARSNPINKDNIAPEFDDLKKIFTKSIFAARDLSVGTCLQKSDIIIKKPGTGIAPNKLDVVLGRHLASKVKSGDMLKFDDLLPR